MNDCPQLSDLKFWAVWYIFYNCTALYTCISPWWHGIHCFSWLSDEQVFEISHVNLKHTESEEKCMVAIHRFPKKCLNCSWHHPWQIWTPFLRFFFKKKTGTCIVRLGDLGITLINLKLQSGISMLPISKVGNES